MSDPSELERQFEVNRRYFAGHRDEIRTEHAGKFVALALGKVVAVGPTSQSVIDAVERLDPRRLHVEVFPAEAEPLWDTLLSPSVEFAR